MAIYSGPYNKTLWYVTTRAGRVRLTRTERAILLAEAGYRAFPVEARKRSNPIVDGLVQIGRDVASGVGDLLVGVSFLGQIIVALARALTSFRRLRGVSIVHHMDNFGFQGVPIIALINFIVGAIVAQQGIYQLRRFGAPTYAIDLLGILTLRELGVLMTSIMVAGRTGQDVAEVAATYFAAEAFFRLDHIANAARGIVVSDYFDRLALDRALDAIGDAERRLTAAMAGDGAAGALAVQAWVAPRRAEVDRIRMAVNEIANSGLTLSKLSVAASLVGDLVKS